MTQTGPRPLALRYDPDAVIRDQASLIGQLQTQVIMRDSALRGANEEIARLTELIPKDEPADDTEKSPPAKRPGRTRPQGE